MKRGELEDMVRKGYRMYFLSKYRIPPHLEILEHEKLKGVIFVKNIKKGITIINIDILSNEKIDIIFYFELFSLK